MSMNGEFREITPALLDKIVNNPALVNDVLRSIDGGGSDSIDPLEYAINALPENNRKMMRKMLAQASPEKRANVLRFVTDKIGLIDKIHKMNTGSIDTKETARRISIDKSWHGLHFLLTGDAVSTPQGAGQAILGGKEIGPDLGYGPARVMDPAQVKAVATALASTSKAELSKKYDPNAMDGAQIYPGEWNEEAENLGWLLESFDTVVEFYRTAAEHGNAVMLYLI
jgi:hypothetical protein